MPQSSEPAAPVPERETIWLLGQPRLTDYIAFVQTKAVGGNDIPAVQLVEEWRAANDHYYDLADREAGLADRIKVRPLPKALRPLAERLRAHPWFRHSFDELPTTIAMVELDKLVVSQIHVEPSHHEGRATELGDDLERRFHFCMPTDRRLPDVRVERLGEHRWRFSSDSTDLRGKTPLLLRGSALDGLLLGGPAIALLGLPVGFGANFMSAVRSGDRVVLQNGYHRAYALRRAGITHAPCIIEEVTRKDELRVAGDEDLIDDPEFYFAAPRPPLLKDFFDPRIAKRLSVRPMMTSVEVEIKVTSGAATYWTD